MNIPSGLQEKKGALSIEDPQRMLFDKLVAEFSSSEHLDNSYAFMIAATWGYLKGQTVQVLRNSGTFARWEYFRPDNRLEMLVLALGFSSGKKIDDIAGCLKLGEGYAKVGMSLLKEELDKPKDFRLFLAKLVYDELEKIDLNPKKME